MDNKKQYSNKDLRNILTDFVQQHTVNVEMHYPMSCEMSFHGRRMVTTLKLNDNALERFFERAGCDVPPPTKMNVWYKGANGSLFFAVEFSQTGNGMIEGYGFNVIGDFYELGRVSWFDKDLTPATNEEVFDALMSEANKIGFKAGQYITTPRGSGRFLCSSDFCYDAELNQLATCQRNEVDGLFDGIFYGGKFAKITEAPKMKRKTWYMMSDGWIVRPIVDQKEVFGEVRGYGFNANGEFFNDESAFETGWIGFDGDETYREATEEEVLKVMIAECVRLGLVFGQDAICAGVTGGVETIDGCNYHLTNYNSNPKLWVKSIRNGQEDQIQLFRAGSFASKA